MLTAGDRVSLMLKGHAGRQSVTFSKRESEACLWLERGPTVHPFSFPLSSVSVRTRTIPLVIPAKSRDPWFRRLELLKQSRRLPTMTGLYAAERWAPAFAGEAIG